MTGAKYEVGFPRFLFFNTLPAFASEKAIGVSLMTPNPSRSRKKAGVKKDPSATSGFYERTFGILKGGGLTQALEESRRKEKVRTQRPPSERRPVNLNSEG